MTWAAVSPTWTEVIWTRGVIMSAASRAALQVATAGKRVGQEAIQLHGGIGVTAEYSVGHRLSRLRALEAQLGDARLHTARLADRVASYGEVESVKAVSDVISPLSGEVLEVNRKVVDEPETVNSDPYGEGWLIRIRLSDASEADDLLDAGTYRAFLAEQ